MKCILHKTIKLIITKRKQIMFALFALICSVLDSKSGANIIKCAAPVVVAAAAAGGTAAAAGGTAVAAGGTAAAAGGTAAAAGGTAAATGGTAAATGGTATTAGGTATTAGGATPKNFTPVSNNQPQLNNNVPKNTNPKGTHTNSLSGNPGSDNLTKRAEGMSEATDKTAKKNASISDTQNETKNSKKDRMMPATTPKNKEEEYDDEIGLDNASKEITKGSGGAGVGCLFGSIFIFIFSIPLMMLLLTNPTSSVMSQIDCDVHNGIDCVEDKESGSFRNKLKNLFTFGSFASNSDVVTNKITDVQRKIKDEGFTINLPLLTSTLFSDSEYSKTEINENNEIVITNKMLQRLEYVEDLARMQMINEYFVYTCNVKVVNDKYIYYKETSYENVNPDTVNEGECNESTVGQLLKERSTQYNEEEYFKRLEESDILDLIYSDYTDSDSLIISKIKTQYYLYNSLNLINIEDENKGNVPLTLMHDSNVNLQAPLKGWYYITSPFGMREGEYAGMHSGIDLIANDKNIYAAGSGIVTRSNVETEGGNVVEITHTASNGVQYVTQYAHLSDRLVSVGDYVNSGDIIGIMGETGTMASGVHLHFQMRIKEPYELLNPNNLFSDASNY